MDARNCGQCLACAVGEYESCRNRSEESKLRAENARLNEELDRWVGVFGHMGDARTAGKAISKEIGSLREELAALRQQQSEPVGYYDWNQAKFVFTAKWNYDKHHKKMLYLAPPAQSAQWKPIETAPKRQYYFKVDGCPAESAHDPNCICWHDEGTGPMQPMLDGTCLVPSSWRTLNSAHSESDNDPQCKVCGLFTCECDDDDVQSKSERDAARYHFLLDLLTSAYSVERNLSVWNNKEEVIKRIDALMLIHPAMQEGKK